MLVNQQLIKLLKQSITTACSVLELCAHNNHSTSMPCWTNVILILLLINCDERFSAALRNSVWKNTQTNSDNIIAAMQNCLNGHICHHHCRVYTQMILIAVCGCLLTFSNEFSTPRAEDTKYDSMLYDVRSIMFAFICWPFLRYRSECSARVQARDSHIRHMRWANSCFSNTENKTSAKKKKYLSVYCSAVQIVYRMVGRRNRVNIVISWLFICVRRLWVE